MDSRHKRVHSRGARGYSRYELHRRNPRALYTRKRWPPGADQSDLDGDTMSKHCRNPRRPRRPTHLPEWPLLRAHQGARQYGYHTTNPHTPRKHSGGAPLGTPPKSKHFPPSLDDTNAQKNTHDDIATYRLGADPIHMHCKYKHHCDMLATSTRNGFASLRPEVHLCSERTCCPKQFFQQKPTGPLAAALCRSLHLFVFRK